MFTDHLFRSSWIEMILHHFVRIVPQQKTAKWSFTGVHYVRAGSRYGLDNSSWHWWVASPSRCCRIFTAMSATRCSSWHGYGGFPKLCKLSSWHAGRCEESKIAFWMCCCSKSRIWFLLACPKSFRWQFLLLHVPEVVPLLFRLLVLFFSEIQHIVHFMIWYWHQCLFQTRFHFCPPFYFLWHWLSALWWTTHSLDLIGLILGFLMQESAIKRDDIKDPFSEVSGEWVFWSFLSSVWCHLLWSAMLFATKEWCQSSFWHRVST